MTFQLKSKMGSVKSINQCEFVMQIIYNIVKAHIGEIQVNSEENESTEFIVILPA